jgi:hypothetical protein
VVVDMSKVQVQTAAQQPQAAIADDLLKNLAELARVPDRPANRNLFYDSIRHTVRVAWTRSGEIKDGIVVNSGALARAAKAIRTANEALAKLNVNETERLTAVFDRCVRSGWFGGHQGVAGCRRLVWQLADALSFSVGLGLARDPDNPERPNSRGRRKGSIQNLTFQMFVCALLQDAENCGGKFTLQKNISKGTLMSAIELLAPYLPPGVIPKLLSPSTLQRIKNKRKGCVPG